MKLVDLPFTALAEFERPMWLSMYAAGRVASAFSPAGAAVSLSVACGSSKTASIAVQPPLADCACGGAGRVCVEIDSISADCAGDVAVAVIVSVYALVADRPCRSAVAVTISVLVLTADPAGSIAVLISVGVHDAAVLGAGRVARSIRVKATLGIQGMNEYRQHQGCKYEARHGTIFFS
jgi:hypothetical protein